MNLTAEISDFRDAVIDYGILDPEGTHQEFVSGRHGRKLDFDIIKRNDPLYERWIDITADFISRSFQPLPEVIIGVANGTNRTALDTARYFGGAVLGLTSVKDPLDSKKLYLPSLARRVISGIKPELVVVHEDVGTSGSNSVQVATACRAAGAQAVEVVTTWQRREKLERLEEAGVPYRAIINEPLPTYTAEDCRDHGFCAEGWEFIPRD